MSKRTIVAGVIVYAGLWAGSYGSLLADSQHQSWMSESDPRENCRSDAGFAAGLSLAPPAWLIVPFVTGFWQHGWQFTCKGENSQ